MKKVLSVLLSLIFMLGILALPAEAASTNTESTLYNNVPKTIKINGTTFNGTYNSKSKKITYKANKSYHEDFEDLENTFSYVMAYETSVTGVNADFQSTWDETTKFLSIVFNDMIRTGKIKTIKFDCGKRNGYSQGFSWNFQTKNNLVTRLTFGVEEGGGEAWDYSYDQKGNLKKIANSYGDSYKINQKDNQITTIEYYTYDQVREVITKHYNENDAEYYHGIWGMLYVNIEKDQDNHIFSISETVKYSNKKTHSTPTVKFTYMKI